MTGRDLVRRSLVLIGVLAERETPSAEQLNDGIDTANELLDSLSTEKLLIPHTVFEEFPLVSGQQSYTIGPGGNFDTVRPLRLQSALIKLTGSSDAIEYPLELLNEQQWVSIRAKTITSDIPTGIFEEDTYPLKSLHIWPKPSAAQTLVLRSNKTLTAIDKNTEIAMAPGYARMLRFNLAQELAPEYGVAVPIKVEQIALESKANIKRLNHRPRYLATDPALRPAGGFDWRTGDSE